MDIVFIVALSAFIIWVLRHCIYWVYLWQAKEYRFDRLLVHLKETVQGKTLLFSPLSFLKWLGILFYIFVIFEDTYLPLFQWYVTGIFVIQTVLIIREVLFHQIKKPELTPKALSLILVSFVTLSLLFTFPLMDKFFWLLVVDRSIALVVGFFVFLHSFPTELFRDYQIRKAMKKIKQHTSLRVIGITGSYGKSSTKAYITQILKHKFTVIQTRGNHHTLSGIASVINERLKPETQLFVCEIGAYGIEEITNICQVIKPQIGILTGINDQHLSLFGSIETSIQAKYELIQSLPKNGLALFNGNDSCTKRLYTKTKKQKVLFGYNKTMATLVPTIYATNITTGQSEISFTVVLKSKKMRLTAPLLGIHALEHVLPAIYLADYFGMSGSEIKKAVLTLKTLPNTMVRRVRKDGVVLLDDTFNSNPESLQAAIEYACSYKKDKYLVFQPMIELGKNAKKEHYRVGSEVANTCKAILVTNTNYIKEITNGITDAKGTCIVITGRIKKLESYLKKNVSKGDIVVFDGNEAKRVMEWFVKT